MIYVEKNNVSETDFISLLEKSKKSMLDFFSDKKIISPLSFEGTVFEHMRDAAVNTGFEGTIRQTGTYAFPDIIANKYFGVEVKMTTNDHWTSTGNSVLESSRIEDVSRIYIVFGKFGGVKDIRYRLYQECLPEISVTHSPRYRINMALPLGKSIFDKIGIEYDTLRKSENQIQIIKNFYRSQLQEGEELWWIDQDDSEKSVSPIIKPYRSLSEKERENFIVESMILFPEMFGNSPTKFERAAAYLIAQYNAVSASLRDLFTAGGKIKITVNGKQTTVPQVAFRLYVRAKDIEKKINSMDAKVLAFYWRCKEVDSDRLKQWQKTLDKKFSLTMKKVKASDIFETGFNEKDEKLPKQEL